MIKKIILGTLFTALIGFLIFGAVNRTIAKSTDIRIETEGGGRYQALNDGNLQSNNLQSPLEKNQQLNRSETDSQYGIGRQGETENDDLGNGYNRSDNQQGLGNGLTRDDNDRTGTPDPQATAGEWAAYTGTVVINDPVMILVETSEGIQIEIEGRAWSYAQEMGFSTAVGNALQINGFHEDGEYKVATIEDLTTGQTIITRDENGRPGWAGNGWGTLRTSEEH
jgi:hypothetical protein